MTREQLRAAVGSMAATLREAGVVPGDRVVGIVRNASESLVACLGTTAIGAVWSSVSPDLGTEAILSRFQQLSRGACGARESPASGHAEELA